MKALKQFGRWLKSVFSKVQKLIDKVIPKAVDIVQAVKKSIDNGTLSDISDALQFIFPKGSILIDKAEKFLEEHIPELCVQLEIIEAVNLSDKTEEAIKQALDALKETYGDKWEQFTSGLAGDLAIWLADGKIDASERKEMIKKAKDFYDTNFKAA